MAIFDFITDCFNKRAEKKRTIEKDRVAAINKARADISATVIKVLEDHLLFDDGIIIVEDRLDQLWIDALDLTEIWEELEMRLGIDISDEELLLEEKPRITVAELITIVKQYVPAV